MKAVRIGTVLASVLGLLVVVGDADAASVRVRCEKRIDPGRSKISVDGNDLEPGTYTARVRSRANEAVSEPQPTIGDEVEFDFDSNTNEDATPIAPKFIAGRPGRVTGEILDETGEVVASATARCRFHD
jgi:hypothetical protein